MTATPPPANPPDPNSGESITCTQSKNTYTIGEKIGEGNFGTVYACTDGWNNDLAVKVLKPIVPYEQQMVAAAGEFQRLLYLRNPYITFVYDAFEYRQTFYIVTERCHWSVSDVLQLPDLRGDLWLFPIARCLLQAVHYLHINSFVHQDIHPGNVFAAVVKDELSFANNESAPPQTVRFKLGDLGIAQIVSDMKASGPRAQWMLPPEVLNPSVYGPMDHRLDIYHLGLLFLQILWGKPLQFSATEVLAGKPRELALSLPAPYSTALEKALRRRVPFRTGSAQELWRDLHAPVAGR